MEDDTTLVEILVVEDRFQITGRGLILVPSFPLRQGEWNACSGTSVVVETPDGNRLSAMASLCMTHLRYSDPVEAARTGRSAWQVVVLLRDLDKDAVPVGSRILAPRDIASALAALT